MKMFPYYCDEKYMVAVKGGNKRKSKNFYYRHVCYNHGVEFIKRPEYAHTSPSKKETEFLIRYLQKRIAEVGLTLRA
jgi:hypothetical protein